MRAAFQNYPKNYFNVICLFILIMHENLKFLCNENVNRVDQEVCRIQTINS